MTTDSRAACAGKAELFESEDLMHHREAAKICGGCEVIEACKANLTETIAAYGYGPHVGPRGTWAGLFLAPDYKGREKVA